MATLGSFNPTTWVSGSAPGISAAQLQRLEEQIDLLDRPWSAQAETFDRDINLDTITWHRNSGIIKVAAHLSPFVAGNWSLGTPALPWQNLFVDYIADRVNAVKFGFIVPNQIRVFSTIGPNSSNTTDLGFSTLYWRTLHYANLSQHSDERDKPYMESLTVPIAALRDLAPIRFRRDDETRTSFGFGAQTLDVWLADWMPDGDYSIVTAPGSDPDERWGMDGTQLLPAMVGWMQELLERVEALEAE